jgi:hypothetical protein
MDHLALQVFDVLINVVSDNDSKMQFIQVYWHVIKHVHKSTKNQLEITAFNARQERIRYVRKLREHEHYMTYLKHNHASPTLIHFKQIQLNDILVKHPFHQCIIKRKNVKYDLSNIEMHMSEWKRDILYSLTQMVNREFMHISGIMFACAIELNRFGYLSLSNTEDYYLAEHLINNFDTIIHGACMLISVMFGELDYQTRRTQFMDMSNRLHTELEVGWDPM